LRRKWRRAAPPGAADDLIEEGQMTAAIDRTMEESMIRAMLQDWVNAIRAKDADAIVSCQSEPFVHYSLAPPLLSTASDKKGLNDWFDTWEGPLGYEIHDLSITLGDGAAFCTSLNRLSGTKVGGAKNSLWLRLTLGLRKIDGEWKIVHEHESVPFYMDGSFRAAVDLEP
jgi:PhnB protein